MSDVKIMVVDDEARMRKLVRDYLVKSGYFVIEAVDGEDAYNRFINTRDISLIVMDIMMPKMDGYETTAEIRKISNVPIILLTAKSDEKDELKGYEQGVDEYITKPFSPKILVARIEAVLRRTNSDEDSVIEAGGISLDISAHKVTVDGQEIELSFKEFELLEYFMNNQGTALSREKILNNVWNYDFFGDARTIDTHVKKLRAKLGSKGEYIRTIWALGYKFEV
ncbi:MAG: response regulator transcription factor [Eubacterium sp.]|nr:response regulator transcription factor [Eubacterium sp.]